MHIKQFEDKNQKDVIHLEYNTILIITSTQDLHVLIERRILWNVVEHDQ